MVTTTANLTTNRTRGRVGGQINIIGIHTMEAPEGEQTAENVANYFKKVRASAHWCVDNNSRVRVVEDEDTAWTLPPINSRSLNIELAGYARQSPGEWTDRYSADMLNIAAVCCAEWCIKYDIPIQRLSDAQIRAGVKGFAGHVDVNRVYKKSSHWDPGPHFPWDHFLNLVEHHFSRLTGTLITTPEPAEPEKPKLPFYMEDEMTSFVTEALTDAYNVETGRAPSEQELAPRRLRIAQNQTTLAIEIASIDKSVESNRYAVHQLYKELLGRDGGVEEWDFWIREANNDIVAIRAAITNSEEHQNRLRG